MSKIYGIDLGTTNSILGLGDTLLTPLVPSVVDLQTGRAGVEQVTNLQAVRSFKRDMRADEGGRTAVVASARVLNQLVKESGENVERVVISVPAYFSDSQRQATIEAAEKVGLEVVELINEPTAAAIYASKSRRSLSLIFDLGGGTFDVTVVDSRFGDYDVQATDGCPLGGDDFDKGICRYLMKVADVKQHHLNPESSTRLLRDCTDLKVRIQKSRQPEVIDLTPYGAGAYTLTVKEYVEIMRTVLGPAIVKAKRVVDTMIPLSETYDLILVGGSTRCPFLQEWVAEEMGQAPVEMTYNPDYIIAQGASLYAQMISEGTAYAQVSDVTKALSIGLANGTSKIIISANAKIPVQESTAVINSVQSSYLQIDLYQGDNMLSERNEYIGQLVYDYGKEMAAGMGLVMVGVTVERSGIIRLSCKEKLKPPVEVVLNRNASRL